MKRSAKKQDVSVIAATQRNIMRLSGRRPLNVHAYAIKVLKGLVANGMHSKLAMEWMLTHWSIVTAGAGWGSDVHFTVAQIESLYRCQMHNLKHTS